MDRLQSTKKAFTIFGVTAAVFVGGYFYAVSPHHSWENPKSAQGLLEKADALSWTNRWAAAAPIYSEAATMFQKQNQPAKALYAEVSELPVDESISVAAKIPLLPLYRAARGTRTAPLLCSLPTQPAQMTECSRCVRFGK